MSMSNKYFLSLSNINEYFQIEAFKTFKTFKIWRFFFFLRFIKFILKDL